MTDLDAHELAGSPEAPELAIGDVAPVVSTDGAVGPEPMWKPWMRDHAEQLVTGAVVTACVLLVLRVLHPNLLLRDTTPTGGDMGAHVWAPAFLRDEVLQHWRLTGWAPSWYGGLPIYQFYMVIPPLMILALDLVMPYNVAFKLVSVSGLLTLPIAAYAFGRLARMRFPLPPLLAVGTLPFLFDRGFKIYGGNIASTMAGEFNFSVALSLGLLYLGLLIRLCNEKRGPVLTAVVLALTVLSHLLVGIFVAFATVVILVIHAWGRRPVLRRAAPTLAIGAALTGFWTVPFWFKRHYTIDMGWSKLTDYWHQLLAPRMMWALLLAVLALVKMVRERERSLLSLLGITVVMGLVFRLVPAGSRLWNARMLQFAWLGIYLMAAVGVAELVHQLGAISTRAKQRRAVLATPVAAMVVATIFVGLPMGALGWSNRTAIDGTDNWLALSGRTSYLPAWIEQNYGGYESRPAWPEYRDVTATMAQLGRDRGCGRALWEYDGDRIGSYGTPMALMLLPYWTHGCIDSMEGLYFESSPTTPFHFLMAAEVTQKPSNPVTFPNTNLYRPIDFDHGIEHMRLYGIRYYMALSPEAIAAAGARPELTEVARSGPWVVYELSDAPLVQGIDRMPYVEAGSDKSAEHWTDTGVATWDPINGHRYYAAPSGPQDWPRIQPGDPIPDVAIRQPAQVSNIRADAENIRFTVDQVGKPVLVKVNYFPNWKVSGADGPYRVTPNLMVVVPTQREVHLHYGSTPSDHAGMALSVAGVVGAIALVIIGRRGSDDADGFADDSGRTEQDPDGRLEHDGFERADVDASGPAFFDTADPTIGSQPSPDADISPWDPPPVADPTSPEADRRNE